MGLLFMVHLVASDDKVVNYEKCTRSVFMKNTSSVCGMLLTLVVDDS